MKYIINISMDVGRGWSKSRESIPKFTTDDNGF